MTFTRILMLANPASPKVGFMLRPSQEMVGEGSCASPGHGVNGAALFLAGLRTKSRKRTLCFFEDARGKIVGCFATGRQQTDRVFSALHADFRRDDCSKQAAIYRQHRRTGCMHGSPVAF